MLKVTIELSIYSPQFKYRAIYRLLVIGLLNYDCTTTALISDQFCSIWKPFEVNHWKYSLFQLLKVAVKRTYATIESLRKCEFLFILTSQTV